MLEKLKNIYFVDRLLDKQRITIEMEYAVLLTIPGTNSLNRAALDFGSCIQVPFNLSPDCPLPSKGGFF
ncbi:MAG: hypothetical protein GX767_06370 [Firmicutes bacterium]|nr:hypothetical protein [Bacillota bacterium]